MAAMVLLLRSLAIALLLVFLIWFWLLPRDTPPRCTNPPFAWITGVRCTP